MSNQKAKAIKKIRKKRMWPALLGFVVFVFLIGILFIGLISFFFMYTVGMKVLQEYSGVERMAEIMDTGLGSEKWDWQKAANMTQLYNGEDSEFYVKWDEGVVFSDFMHRPDFNESITIELDKQYRFYPEKRVEAPRGIFGLHISEREVIQKTLAVEEGQEIDRSWLQTIIWQEYFWTKLPLQTTEYEIYTRFALKLQRQDIFFAIMVMVIGCILMLIPMCFLLVNTIRVILTQRSMVQLLYQDNVTGGRNWLYFQNSAVKILKNPLNAYKTYAVVNLHMERYQNFCACYGVKEGESLLEGMNGLLKARTSRRESFARYEAADFGLLLRCEGESEQQKREYCLKRLYSLLAELTGLRPELKIHFQAGIYMLAPRSTEGFGWNRNKLEVDMDQYYNYASAARLSTDHTNLDGIIFFDEEMLKEQLWERKVEDTMEIALRNEEFQIYLQPKYNPSDGRLVGAEALVRWVSPTEGYITPNRFIPIFEENGFIMQLDDYMVSHVAKMLAEWRLQGIKPVPVSINISRAHFSQEGLAEHICQLVDAYGPSHSLIELEVTESAFFDDKDILINTVKQLKAYGFGVSMDDFGSGYSSLNSLKDIPLDALKIDGEFFRGEGDSRRGRIVVQETIMLARHLEMKVVAEGIEKKEQVEFLAENGCDMIQGYYYAKPMPVWEFVAKVEKDA